MPGEQKESLLDQKTKEFEESQGQNEEGTCKGKCGGFKPGQLDEQGLCPSCSEQDQAGGGGGVGGREEAEEKETPPSPEELANMQLEAGNRMAAGVKPGEEPNEAQQQYMDYLDTIADEKGADGKSARDEMIMDNEDAQAEAAEKYAAFKQKNPEATMSDYQKHSNEEFLNQEVEKASAAMTDYEHQQGTGGTGLAIDEAEGLGTLGDKKHQEQNEFSGENEFGGKDEYGVQTDGKGDKGDKKGDKDQKGDEQNDGKKASASAASASPPKEGWFRWLEKTWPAAIKNPALAAPCKQINMALQKAITASVYGNVVRVVPVQPNFNVDPVGATFATLRALEDPLIYSGLILVGSNGFIPIAGPILFGLPAIFLYSAIEPVALLRFFVDKILNIPPLSIFCIALKTAVEKATAGGKTASKPA